MEIKPVTLQGKHVRLEPMTEAHIPGLTEIGVGQTFWDFMLYGNIKTEEDMRAWVRDILSRAEKELTCRLLPSILHQDVWRAQHVI